MTGIEIRPFESSGATDAEYEALALRLAREPQLLAELRRKLGANRLTHPLFDAPRYARHLEAAFTRMWEIWVKGEAPQPFAITPLPIEETAERAIAPVRIPAQSGATTTILRVPFAACPLCGGADHSLQPACHQLPRLGLGGLNQPVLHYEPEHQWK